MESKLPVGPVRSRTWHSTSTDKIIVPSPKRPATTLGISHPPVVTSTVTRRYVARPKTTTGTINWPDIIKLIRRHATTGRTAVILLVWLKF